ncbi:7995_t:CDS:2 [Entrophospora sp. SA101]|nr:7995_t:CDS:2 [Entrophospora sp. SA101]
MGKASLVAAKKRDKLRNWNEYLTSPSIRIDGHVSNIEQADNYLIDCCLNRKRLDVIFNHLRYSPKDNCIRYGHVENVYSNVREIYFIPLEVDDKVPEVVTFLDYDGKILDPESDKKRDSKLLLGAIVIADAESSKSKRRRDVVNGGGNRLNKKEQSDHKSGGIDGILNNLLTDVKTKNLLETLFPQQNLSQLQNLPGHYSNNVQMPSNNNNNTPGFILPAPLPSQQIAYPSQYQYHPNQYQIVLPQPPPPQINLQTVSPLPQINPQTQYNNSHHHVQPAFQENSEVRKALIVQTRRPDGRCKIFDDNACVLINNRGELLGTKILGVISIELRDKKSEKIVKSKYLFNNAIHF